MHPFGREEESSRQALFGFFTLCLQRGEWELAGACVPQLCEGAGDMPHCPQDMVRAIVQHPYPLPWETVGSPHRLAWLWLQALEKYAGGELSLSVRRELEFLLLLEELEQDVPDSMLTELHQMFLDAQLPDRSVSECPGPGVGAGVRSCIRSLLAQRRPRLARTLIDFLQRSPGLGDGATDRTLQDVFVQHLMERVALPAEERGEEWAEEVCAALALMPGGGAERAGDLEPLWEGLWAARGGALTEERVLGRLLRPQSATLISLYCSCALRLLRAELLQEAAHTQVSSVDLPEAEKLMLGLCCHGDRPAAWKAIYFECLSSSKHFLQQVLATGLDLIKREEFSCLEALLKAEFQPLSRLLLLLGWKQCQSLDSAQTLLRVLHQEQARASDSVLVHFADGLSSQLGVLEWCVSSNPGITREALLPQLQSLDQHSALYVLHSLTPLVQHEERKVLDLLQGLIQPSEPGSSEVVDAANGAVQRNMTLFRGFCAMKYALYALCANAHAHAGGAEDGVLRKQQHPSPESQEEADREPESSEGCSALFQHFLSECQLYLEAVPAMLRLELLENIFSLLFLSNVNFTQPGQTESNTEVTQTSTTVTQTSTTVTQNSTTVTQNSTLVTQNSTTVTPTSQTQKNGTEPKAAEDEPEAQTDPGEFGPEGERRGPQPGLSHLAPGCRGFLADARALEGFLRLLREGLEGMIGLGRADCRAMAAEAEAGESLGCSVTAECFSARLQRLSKRTAEAQWRLQIISSNHENGSGVDGPVLPSVGLGATLPLRRSSGGGAGVAGVRRKKRGSRHRTDRHANGERQNGEVSTGTSDGGGGAAGAGAEWKICPCGGPHSWLVPAMLSPPESLLVSCIRRGNFMEAHQVMLMFGLENAACSGELGFMERYREVLDELSQVEQKMESQALSSPSSSSEALAAVGTACATGTAGTAGTACNAGTAGPARSRLGSSSRVTLQSIGSAAAAGMAFYSISDVADRLLSTPARPLPCLEEGYWLGRDVLDRSGPVYPLLEELSPAGMAAFDLACCQCQLWKTSRQLLETAERRLNLSLEARGLKVNSRVPHPEGVHGFPAVMQQISKILNHTATGKGPAKTEAAGEDNVVASPFGCSAQEVLLCWHPSLSEEGIAARLNLSQRLEVTLRPLTSATDTTETRVTSGGALLAALQEQAALKQAELDSHPVRSGMKQLLRCLDQLCPFELDGVVSRPDYMRSFLDYVNMLASVLVRSLGSEDQTAEVKLGNPLLVLLQSPTQLLSHLLFDRQVSPDRVLALLQQEGLSVSVQQVIVQHCCEALPVWDSRSTSVPQSHTKAPTAFCPESISTLLHQHALEHTPTLTLPETIPIITPTATTTTSNPSTDSDASEEDISTTTTTTSTTTTTNSTTTTSTTTNSNSTTTISVSSPPPSPSSSQSSSSSSSTSSVFLLTSSALGFLKSRSPLLAALACLSASRGGSPRATIPSWPSLPSLPSYFRGTGGGRKEAPLDGEQVSREAEVLLRDFPVLRAYLQAMAQPVLGTPPGEEAGLGAALCGKPLVAMLLSGPRTGAAQALAADAFRQALGGGDLSRALDLLELYGQNRGQEGALRDRLLACAALGGDERGTEQLFRVQDADLRARVVLQGLEGWPLGGSVELLHFCLSDPHTAPAHREQLQQKSLELDMYHRMLSLQPALPWETWQELKESSVQEPERVLSMMLEAREFQLCTQWVQLYPVSEQSTLELQTQHLLWLLERGQTEDAFQLLEGLSGSSGLQVSERALDSRPGLAACHFLSDYLTLHYQSQVTPARRRHIHALHLGSKVLLTLPAPARQDYFPLLSEPLLMLEQLLMNLKVDWADTAVRTLRNLLLAQEAGLSNEHMDTLLAEYASKALDFPYAPRERVRSDSVISLQDMLQQCPAQESGPASPTQTPPPSAGSTPMHTPCRSGGDGDRGSGGKRAGTRTPATPFSPPEKTPERKDWIPDHQQHICMVCQRERFTMFNRRHHCRRCGRLVCQACSSRRMALGVGEEAVRVCDQCHSFFHCDSDEEMEQIEVAGSPVAAEGALEGVLSLPEVPQRQYRLSTNPAVNQQIHSEFYYEQAPSASLCVAILNLHSDQTACGHQLIGHCRSLSRKLTNPEVDARLLTEVMRQLLISAKLLFVKVGRNQDLALCDSYISKVDVLKILVMANYKDIPSLDDILEMAAVTRLRNQLLESEYYQLAVEVSTKSGLDPSGVWHAWGLALLKVGYLGGAREKFARCLKAPVERGQLNMGPRLLQEIIQHLETTVHPTLTTPVEEDVLASLRELEEALGEQAPPERPESQALRCSRYQECLYYLLTYGTHLALVSFYMRHDHIKEALAHLLSKECPEEVFLEGVLQPCLERGRLGDLQGLMEVLEPSLEAWSRHLMAACQLLQRRGHYHTLYQLQKFMMDHVRAAMTCIRFFTHGAQSYLQLGEQQRWLVRAKEHLRTYLQEQQGRGATRRKAPATSSSTSSSSFRKRMSASDVSRHMNTIELQLEVTRFLQRCESSTPAKVATMPSSSAPPTLFGGSPMKVDVACKVMLGGKNIEEGFGIAYRVIQDFQLEALAVYVRAGQLLVRQRQYPAVRQLLKCVGESGAATRTDLDAIVLSCVSVADKSPGDAKELESLILEAKSSETKIKAFLLCSKLRAAYLLAVKLEVPRASPLVQEVLQAAEGAGDSVMQDICRQWLAEHQERLPRQRQARGNPR